MVDAAMMVKALKLTELVPSSTGYLPIEASDVNRPGLPFAGFWEHFADERPQILGLVETSYLHSLDPETRKMRLQQFVSYDLPCIVICRRLEGMDDLIQMAAARKIPVYRSDVDTTKLVMDMIYFLNNHLAPRMTMHGVLAEVYGVGVLLTGESGVGKSENAMALLSRGHRLVADDAIDVRRIGRDQLIGTAPELIRYFMEIRGIGLVDARHMFGIGAVKQEQAIDLVVHFEPWDDDKVYDRLGAELQYTDILGVKVPIYEIPVRPGRNLADILELAAMNNRGRKMGYNAAQTLVERHDKLVDRG